MAEPEPYVYEALERPKEQIRLLELHRTFVEEQPIHGSFQLRNIIEPNDEPNYIALSYHWGTDEHEEELFIDSKFVRIRKNLAVALRFLRGLGSCPKHVWIYALCINQADDKERNPQVSVMADIYHAATEVRIWLGDEDKESDSALGIDFANEVLNLRRFDQLIRDQDTSRKWNALSQIMRRKWFSCRWVIQEVAHAKRAILCCGKAEIPWEDFADAIELFKAESQEVSGIFRRDPKYFNNPAFLGQINALAATDLVTIMHDLFRPLKTHQAEAEMQQPQLPQRSLQPLQPLENLLSTFLSFETSNPRDIVYSVLSLSKDFRPTWYAAEAPDAEDRFGQARNLVEGRYERDTHETRQGKLTVDALAKTVVAASRALEQKVVDKQFEVDYRKSIFEVYRELVASVIRNSKSLDIICLPWSPVEQEQGVRLPTWIGRLREKPFALDGENKAQRVNADPLVGARYQGSRKYNASGGNQVKDADKIFPISADDCMLFAKGFRLAEVSEKGSTAGGGVIAPTWLTMADWRDQNHRPPDDFWRTLIADRALDGSNPPAWYRRACQQLWQKQAPNSYLNMSENLAVEQSSKIIQFLNRVCDAAWGRRLIRTTDGDLGLAPQDTKKGDIICILYGCSVPVILRKLGPKSSEPPPHGSPPARRRRRTNSNYRLVNSATTSDGFDKGPADYFQFASKIRKTGDTASAAHTNNLEVSHSQYEGFVFPQSPTIRVQSPDAFRPNSPGLVPSAATSSEAPPVIPEESQTTAQSPPAEIHYNLVGACYIHGYMDGEAIERRRANNAQFPTQTFAIV